eukprot:358248-Chlamydomonas_euryale.AAC.2
MGPCGDGCLKMLDARHACTPGLRKWSLDGSGVNQIVESVWITTAKNGAPGTRQWTTPARRRVLD